VGLYILARLSQKGRLWFLTMILMLYNSVVDCCYSLDGTSLRKLTIASRCFIDDCRASANKRRRGRVVDKRVHRRRARVIHERQRRR
jgi:hypothetical protein